MDLIIVGTLCLFFGFFAGVLTMCLFQAGADDLEYHWNTTHRDS